MWFKLITTSMRDHKEFIIDGRLNEHSDFTKGAKMGSLRNSTGNKILGSISTVIPKRNTLSQVFPIIPMRVFLRIFANDFGFRVSIMVFM